MILVVVAFFRELFGSGTLFNYPVFEKLGLYELGFFKYMNNGLMLLAPAAFFLIACVIWFHRAKDKNLQEK